MVASSLWISGEFSGQTPQSIKYRLGMELRSQTKVSGSQTIPRAPSESRKAAAAGTNRIDEADNVNNMACVNSPSSATGVIRDGKGTSRILPTEGGWFRAFGP